MFALIVLVVSVLVSAVTGFFVYARNPNSRINRTYGLLTLTLVMLSITNYFSLGGHNRLTYIRLVIFCSSLVVACLYYLVIFLGDQRARLSRLQQAGVYFTAIVAVLDLTPVVFSGLSKGADSVPMPNAGVALFLLQFVGFLVGNIIFLAKRIAASRGVLRLQYEYLLLGICPILLFAPITGFLMPVVFKNTAPVVITPVYGAFFVCIVGYAIVKHRLFDVNFFVVRAVAYLTTLFIMTFLLVAPVVLLSEHLLGLHLGIGKLALVVLFGVFVLYVLQYLRKVFDSLTTRLFFRHYYNPQDVLDGLSGVLVRTADVDVIREDTASILKGALETNMLRYILFADRSQNDAKLARKISACDSNADTNVIDVDDSEGHEGRVITLLKSEDITLAIRLRTKHEDLGYLILGRKQSGEIYNNRDRQLLSVAASEIAISLQNALRFEEIQNFNITLQRKVEDATSQLRRNNRRLRELDNTKDDFISMASHQLRTPLTSVKGYLSMVLDGDAGQLNGNQRKLLEQSYRSCQQMVYLISDLLNLSRINTGKFVIQPSKVDLSRVIQEEIDQLTETANARGVVLVYDKPASFSELMLDDMKIHQVVMNFIDNAIYYTPTGGTVTVALRETPSAVEYTVKDTGIGVPKSVQHKLFTKFYRAENAQKARPDGTGLGLFMAKKVIAAQDGAIIFESEEGKGSTFGFRFNKATLLAAKE